MSRPIALRSVLSALLALLVASPLAAHEYEVDGYVIHYNALPTDQLAANVATAYGIIRSKTRAMLNVSVIKKVPNTTGTAVPAQVNVHANNLNGQLKPMVMRRIDEQTAIYYIGEVSVTDGETLVFDIYVTPEGEKQTFNVRFKQTFYAR
ncbi:MAG TPA: DUF4426 domain-containing protein [Gammaproteobacteria bacterium]|nr:DUF4426 domain-containing protein [Gammaproteobacteria bacterium]